MVQKELFPIQVPGEAPHPVVHGDDVRVEGADEIVQGGKGGDLPAGSHVDVHTEGGKAGLRVVLRVGVDGDMLLSRWASWVSPAGTMEPSAIKMVTEAPWGS